MALPALRQQGAGGESRKIFGGVGVVLVGRGEGGGGGGETTEGPQGFQRRGKRKRGPVNP